MLQAIMSPPTPLKPMCLLTAITVLALAATIHNTDRAVINAGYRVLPKLKPEFMPVVLKIINAPSPLAHMNQYVATLPQRILTMKLNTPVMPMLDVG